MSRQSGPIAIETAKANTQHYEVGIGVRKTCLGPRMKYSYCLYPRGAEILRSRRSRIHGRSALISKAKRHTKVYRVSVIGGDVVTSDFGPETFNRVISVELFEHMKHYQLPLTRVAKALKPQGELFIHIFARKGSQYDFEDGWMGTHFFTGGTMPSTDRCISSKATSPWSNSGRFLVSIMREPARISLRRWMPARKRLAVSGRDIMENTAMWFYRWQIFYMACAELFTY